MEPTTGSESFVERFGRLRERHGLTKSALAAPRYTVSYVSQIESGRRTPSGEALAYFADRLAVSASYLLGGVPDGLEERLAYRVEEGRVALRAGDLQEAYEVAIQVLEESERFALASARAQALVLAADALSMLGRTREAIDRYEEALEEGLTERQHGIVVAQLAAAYRTVGDLSYAADLVESKLKELHAGPLDPGVSAELNSVLVSIYFERGDVTRAELVARRALAAASEGASPLNRANALWNASRVLAEGKRWDEALELAREARLIVEGLNDQLRLARVHSAYAYICLETEPPRLDEAATHLEDAEALLGPNGAPHELAYVYAEQGRLALLSDQAHQALVSSEQALANVADDPLQRASCLFLRGRALTELARPHDALDDFHEAAAVFEKTGARQQFASCFREIGEIESNAGELGAAVEAFRVGLEALDPRRSGG